MAILCAEAAQEFVEVSEGEFQIVGAVMQNSDIFVIAREPAQIFTMVQNKDYQEDLLRKRFGDEARIAPLMVGAVPYALIRGDADAGIMDYTKAMLAEDAGALEKTSTYGDYDSFVLVANREFMKSRLYRDFINEFNTASTELAENKDTLRRQMIDYVGIDIKEKGWEEWTIRIKTLKAYAIE